MKVTLQAQSVTVSPDDKGGATLQLVGVGKAGVTEGMETFTPSADLALYSAKKEDFAGIQPNEPVEITISTVTKTEKPAAKK